MRLYLLIPSPAGEVDDDDIFSTTNDADDARSRGTGSAPITVGPTAANAAARREAAAAAAADVPTSYNSDFSPTHRKRSAAAASAAGTSLALDQDAKRLLFGPQLGRGGGGDSVVGGGSGGGSGGGIGSGVEGGMGGTGHGALGSSGRSLRTIGIPSTLKRLTNSAKRSATGGSRGSRDGGEGKKGDKQG